MSPSRPTAPGAATSLGDLLADVRRDEQEPDFLVEAERSTKIVVESGPLSQVPQAAVHTVDLLREVENCVVTSEDDLGNADRSGKR